MFGTYTKKKSIVYIKFTSNRTSGIFFAKSGNPSVWCLINAASDAMDYRAEPPPATLTGLDSSASRELISWSYLGASPAC